MNSLDRLQFMLSFALQALLLTGVTILIERRCTNARIKTQVWTCYYVSLILVLVTGLVLPRLQWGNPWQLLAPRELLAVVRYQRWLSAALLSVWVGGMVYRFSRWLLNFRRVQKFLRSCRSLDADERLRVLSLAPSTQLRALDGEIEIKIGPEELGPSCYQFHRPVVILPPSLLSGNDEHELQFVLQHELEHLRTRHPLQAFAQRVVETILWFLPPVRKAGRRAGLAREYVCDDAATSRGASTASYLRTLLRFAQLNQCCFGATLGLNHSMSDLRIRAERLATPPSQRSGRLATVAPALVIVFALMVSQLWLPTHPLASVDSTYSAWPSWSASALHTFNITVRDFDEFDPRLQVFDLLQGQSNAQGQTD